MDVARGDHPSHRPHSGPYEQALNYAA
jgi:hypothetical protein